MGRALTERYPQREQCRAPPCWRWKGWTVTHPQHPEREALRKISFSVRAGEIVGVAGLMGAGRTELAMSPLPQLGPPGGGHSAHRRPGRGPEQCAQGHEGGPGLRPKTARASASCWDQPIAFNTSLANLDAFATGGVVNAAKEHSVAEQSAPSQACC